MRAAHVARHLCHAVCKCWLLLLQQINQCCTLFCRRVRVIAQDPLAIRVYFPSGVMGLVCCRVWLQQVERSRVCPVPADVPLLLLCCITPVLCCCRSVSAACGSCSSPGGCCCCLSITLGRSSCRETYCSVACPARGQAADCCGSVVVGTSGAQAGRCGKLRRPWAHLWPAWLLLMPAC